MELSRKHQAFVNEYLIDFNATRGAERAGYRGNANTLAVTGHYLLRNPKIAEAIDQRLSEDAMRPTEVLKRMAEQARGAHAVYITPDGVDMHRLLADGKGHLIKSIKDTAYGRSIEFYDAQTALHHIGKHFGLFADNLKVSGDEDNPLVMRTERVDYRNAVTDLAPGPVSDSDSSGEG